MVGRAEEQRFISDSISNPDRTGVLVAGQAGVGKTCLVHEVLNATHGHYVQWITASESLRPLPFGALAELLPSNLPVVGQMDLLAVLGQALLRRAEDRPIVLAVDDVHLLDGLSAGFIDYIAIRGSATVILTLRSGSPVPDALGRICRGDLPRLELQALSKVEIRQTLERTLDGVVETVSMERIWELPPVMFSLPESSLPMCSKQASFGDCMVCGDGPVELGRRRASEAVAARLEGLTDDGRRFVELLSVGEPLDLVTAEELTADGVLLELERRGLILSATKIPEYSFQSSAIRRGPSS